MGIESKRVRNWLAFSTFASSTHAEDMPREAVVEPLSYIGSFNPFPALVIGVTGAAMAAHAQTYLFQVSQSREWIDMNQSLLCPTGSNPCFMGESTCCLFGSAMSNIFLPVAWPSSIDPSFAASN